MRPRNRIAALALMLTLAGCTGMSDTQQRTLSAGAVGAAGGALIGAAAGSPGWGAAIGGASGLAAGWLYDHHRRSIDASIQAAVRDAR